MACGLRSIQMAGLCRRLPAHENSRICSGIRAGHLTNSGNASRTRLLALLFPRTFEDQLKRAFTVRQRQEATANSAEVGYHPRADSLDEVAVGCSEGHSRDTVDTGDFMA